MARLLDTGSQTGLMAPLSSLVFCFEKIKLIQEYAHAVSEYNRMQSAQVAALRNGDGFEFTGADSGGRTAQGQAKDAILKHEEEHGC
jgi:hypothetical protein